MQEKVNIAITGEKLAKGEDFNINYYKGLKNFQPKIESKYSEDIGISNGEIYIKAGADEIIKQAAKSIGIYVTTEVLANEENKVVIEEAKEGTIENYRIYGNSIQEGTPTPDNPIEVESVGDKTSNLFNKNDLLNGELSTFNGKNVFKYIDTNKLIWKRDIGITAPYTITLEILRDEENKSKVTNLQLRFSDGTTRNIASMKSGIKQTVIITDKTLVEIYSINSWNTNCYLNLDVCQIEYGTKATEYEPYGYKIPIKVNDTVTNIYLDEPLRKVGDYADYIDFESGKVVRNVGKIIYDGTENWGGPYSSYNGYSFTNTLFKDGQVVLCNIAEGILINSYSISVRKAYNAIRMQGFSTTYDTLDSFKQFLSTTNAVILGGLTTPTEETIELPTISTNKGTNIIEVDTTVKPSNIKIEH